MNNQNCLFTMAVLVIYIKREQKGGIRGEENKNETNFLHFPHFSQ